MISIGRGPGTDRSVARAHGFVNDQEKNTMEKDKPLTGKRIAVLVANGFDEAHMTESQRALLGAGASPKVVSTEQGLVNGWHGAGWGHYFAVDEQLATALAADFDGVLIPGGERGIAKLAANPHTRRMLRGFMDGNKPVVAFGHAPQLIALAERARGRTMVASDAVRAVLEAAGAKLADGDRASDANLLTARDDIDIDSFKQAVVDHFVEITGAMANAA
jgi:protease I